MKEPSFRLLRGQLGSLIARANREYEDDLDEGRAFARLSARLDRRRRRLIWAMELGTVSALAVLLLAVFLSNIRRTGASAAMEVAAEPPRAPRPLGSSQRRIDGESADAQNGWRRAEAPSGLHEEHGERRSQAVPSSSVDERSSKARAPVRLPAASVAPSAKQSASVPSASPSEGQDCLSLARAGSTQAAQDCFLKRAEGSGLGAEMALYEVARLRRDVLADPAGALQALTEYRRRFPSGSLRREADMSQLELLIQLGRATDALQRSEELLSASAGERASELHLLRGHVFRKSLGDLRAAEREYALAEGASGASRLEATYFRATCLQALGDGAGASSAFERYLEQGGRNYATEARRRLEALRQ